MIYEARTEDRVTRALSLFKYLKEVISLRIRPVYRVDEYDRVLWFSDLPEGGCHVIGRNSSNKLDQGETWLEVAKPPTRHYPEPPESLIPWLDPAEMADFTLDVPPLAGPEWPEGEDGVEQVPAEITRAWESYVERSWWPWATESRTLAPQQEAYNDFFSLYQRQSRLGEQYEVVVGLGLLSWKTPSGYEVRRHLVTLSTDIVFHPARGLLSIGPAGEGAKPALEQEMLVPGERPGTSDSLAQDLDEMGNSIWDESVIGQWLTAWVQSVSAEGWCSAEISPPSRVSTSPVVNLAPAVILRRRTDRNLVRILEEVIADLEAGGPLPEGILPLLSDGEPPRSDQVEVDDPDGNGWGLEETYFPLPYNEEQIRVLEELEKSPGVLVHGPPGTGKSHTIANLVCHLLATGKRVLVTSHTPRALRVLKKKIPDELTSLCVILLGDDQDAMQSLEQSVEGITQRQELYDERQSERVVKDREAELDELRRREQSLTRQLRKFREAEVGMCDLGEGYRGTPGRIAQVVESQAGQFSWILDYANPEEDEDFGLTDETILELVELLESGTDLGDCAQPPSVLPGSLPDVPTFERSAKAEASLRTQLSELGPESEYPVASSLSRQPAATLVSLRRWFQALAGLVSRPGVDVSWCASVISDATSKSDRLWIQLAELTDPHVQALADLSTEVAGLQVTGVDLGMLTKCREDAQALLQHLDGGGKLGFGPLKPQVVRRGRYLIESVRVGGEACSKPSTLGKLLSWVDVQERLHSLQGSWADYAEVAIPQAPLPKSIKTISTLSGCLHASLKLGEDARDFLPDLDVIGLIGRDHLLDESAIERITLSLDYATLLQKADDAGRPFDQIANSIASVQGANPLLLGKLTQALKERDQGVYEEAYGLVEDQYCRYVAAERLDTILKALEPAAPQLVEKLKATPDPTVDWSSRLRELGSAWHWAQVHSWLSVLADASEEGRLRVSLEKTRKRAGAVTAGLSSELAWSHCLSRLTERERQSLVAWSKAVQLVGKGTGRHAPKHRQAAREYMEGCRSAIPAWIMPIYRVAESFKPGSTLFDVVIIDEASQSGPEALLLFYLARKVIVVGDHKQISPESVGVDREAVDSLQRAVLKEIPYAHLLGVDNSLFDQADIWYRSKVRLREHFRCVPEIIQFSNNLCYKNEPLIPLRQYGSDRLKPPIKTVRVRDAYLKGQGTLITNPPEADALVTAICECHDDPRYRGKSFGVISLQGSAQARAIEQLLLERLGPERMEERQLLCGDSYAFQGDERDVMFLSLVTAVMPDRRIGSLSKASDERRFNVAASRAKDQQWLFHSVDLADLSRTCYRHRVLEYCLSPRVDSADLDGIDLHGLRRQAWSAQRDRDAAPEPFDSWFELDVYLRLRDEGFKVVPQYEIAGYRVDLLIEGMHSRLAVECDGDQWHGPDKWEADLRRQRDLERCGLRFWRVRASTFYADREAAFEELWQILEAARIRTRPVEEPPEEPGFEGEDADAPEAVTSTTPVVAEPPMPVDESHERPHEPEPPIPTGAAGSAVPSSLRTEVWANALSSQDQAPPPSQTHTGPHVFAPYVSWAPRPLPDPRLASVGTVMTGIIEIVTAEGPMVCRRAYEVYATAAGIQRVGRQVKHHLNQATYRAIRSGALVAEETLRAQGLIDRTLRIPESPRILPRRRGLRTLEDIPPSEIAHVMSALNQDDPSADSDELFKAVLKSYGFDRLTTTARTLLTRVHDELVTGEELRLEADEEERAGQPAARPAQSAARRPASSARQTGDDRRPRPGDPAYYDYLYRHFGSGESEDSPG